MQGTNLRLSWLNARSWNKIRVLPDQEKSFIELIELQHRSGTLYQSLQRYNSGTVVLRVKTQRETDFTNTLLRSHQLCCNKEGGTGKCCKWRCYGKVLIVLYVHSFFFLTLVSHDNLSCLQCNINTGRGLHALKALIAARNIHNLYGTMMNKSFMIFWEGLITLEQMRVNFEIQFILHSRGWEGWNYWA